MAGLQTSHYTMKIPPKLRAGHPIDSWSPIAPRSICFSGTLRVVLLRIFDFHGFNINSVMHNAQKHTYMYAGIAKCN